MGAVGGVIRAVSGPPSVSTVSSVKNPALQGNIDQLISGYKTIANSGDTALSDYISKYMAGEGAASQRTGQEIGAMDQFYNGSMNNQLAQLRAQRASAMTDAANVAAQQAIAAQDRSRVTGSGGLGSYNTRMTMASLQPIRVQAALDNANQERQDLGYVTGQQLGLAGQRTALANQQAAYGLVPQQTRMQLASQEAGYLGQLGNLDQQNKFYGLQQKPNTWADVADSLDQGIMNAAAIYGSMGGGMGGMGGKKDGGLIRGPGTGTSDSIPARLSKGEFVVPAEAVRIPGILPLLEKIRHIALVHRMEHSGAGSVTHMRNGGIVAVGPFGEPGHGYHDGGVVQYYADGGLAASAQQLGDRAMRDLTPMWEPATILGGDNMSPVSAGGLGGFQRRPMQTAAPAMPQNADFSPNQYFQPSNYSSITPQWQAYGNAWSKYYNDPSSPGYVAPGTYE